MRFVELVVVPARRARRAAVASLVALSLACVVAAQEPPRRSDVPDRAVALRWRREHPRPPSPAPDPAVLTRELVLARVGAKEEGLFQARGQTLAEHRVSLRDGMSMLFQVYKRGAAYSHGTMQGFARRYSEHVFVAGGENPWVADLTWGDRQPALWPERERLWDHDTSRHCQRDASTCRPDGITSWREARHLATLIVSGRDPTPTCQQKRGPLLDDCAPHVCPVPPDHWGGHMDRDHGEEQGLVRMRCGDALNDGWVAPGRHTPAEVEAARASVVDPRPDVGTQPGAAVPAGLAAGAGSRLR